MYVLKYIINVLYYMMVMIRWDNYEVCLYNIYIIWDPFFYVCEYLGWYIKHVSLLSKWDILTLL